MSALSRFLNADAAAKAVLLAVLGTVPVPAAADAVRAQPTQAGVVTEEQILVALMGEEANMRRVVGMLRDGTDACLSAQARMLGDVGPATTLAPVAERMRGLRADSDADRTAATVDRMLASGHLSERSEAVLLRHARLRGACVDWSERAVAFLAANLAEPGTAAPASRLTQAKAAAGRDLERLMAIRGAYEGEGVGEIEAMETQGPRP